MKIAKSQYASVVLTLPVLVGRGLLGFILLVLNGGVLIITLPEPQGKEGYEYFNQ